MKRLANQSGFSLVEVMVVVAIVLVQLVALNAYYVGFVQQVRSEESATQARVIMMQALSQIQASPGLFPLVYSNTSQPLSTVTCHDEGGLRIANVHGSAGHTGFVFGEAIGLPSGICTNASRYEVQWTKYRVEGQDFADVYVLYRDSKGEEKLTHARVEVQSLL